MRASTKHAVVVLSAIAVSTAGVAGVAALGSQGFDSVSPVGIADAYHDEPTWGNVTLHPSEPGDAYPGRDNASWTWFIGLNRDHTGDWMVLTTDAKDFSGCDTPDVRAEGIIREGQRKYDRPPEGDDTTTAADKSIVSHRKQSRLTEDGIIVEWYDEEDVAGDPPELDASDEGMAAFDDCFVNNDEPGWYQAKLQYNGTTPGGEYITEEYYSHYIYICECDSYEDAEATLGPAPSRDTSSPSSPTPTATATSTPESTDVTDTPAPTEATESPEPDDPTDTPEPTEATATPGSTDAAGDGTAGPQTPSADGSGFGVLVAVLAMLGSGIHWRNKDD